MSPYLSFVVAARNDNYGGDFLHRMQVSVSALLGLWSKYSLDAELIIVEWNPPEHKPRLEEVIAWPKSVKPGSVRIVEVPPEIHHRLPNWHRMPMFEYIAKNVGIRRANGEYVLATNPDIIFSGQIISYLASVGLRPDSFYRVDRYDVGREIPVSLSLEQQLRFCAKHAFRVHRMEECVPARKLTRVCYRLRHHFPYLLRRAILGLTRGAKGPTSSNGQCGGSHRSTAPVVHMRAPGDFLLMANRSWHALRGYPELVTHSHIDSYMVITAAVAGLHQTVLPHPIYHQEHDRSEQAERPLTVLEEIPALKEMLDTLSPRITNDGNWGLGQVKLLTTELGTQLAKANGSRS